MLTVTTRIDPKSEQYRRRKFVFNTRISLYPVTIACVNRTQKVKVIRGAKRCTIRTKAAGSKTKAEYRKRMKESRVIPHDIPRGINEQSDTLSAVVIPIVDDHGKPLTASKRQREAIKFRKRMGI